jgi:hypothetical protein
MGTSWGLGVDDGGLPVDWRQSAVDTPQAPGPPPSQMSRLGEFWGAPGRVKRKSTDCGKTSEYLPLVRLTAWRREV